MNTDKYVPQFQLENLRKHAVPGKVVVLYGPRRVGKTTLLKKFLENESECLFVTGEDIFVRSSLQSQSIEELKTFIGTHKLLIVDEAQYIPSIGQSLKIIVDHIPHVRVVVTGSSSLDLTHAVGEPLTGRQHIIRMFPLSQMELGAIENASQTKALLENRLIYGSYPEVITSSDIISKQEYLQELVSSYLLKDILAFEGIQKSKKILDLLTLLALQLQNEVSVQELATQLSMSKQTVERYLDLLEKTFVIINLRGFSRNLRNEVTKTSKYYFYDTGIRNAIINNFNPLERRNDAGGLWENYLVMERIKKQTYKRIWSQNYFWRTYDQKKVDWVEEREGKLFGFEFKWGKSSLAPKLWKNTYPDASYECITRENYLPFIA